MRNKKLNIGIDFDGVIADCGALKREGAMRLFGMDIPEEKFKKEIVVGEGLLTMDQYRALQKQIYETMELGLLAKIVPDAKKYIEKLLQDGHTITVITSRSNDESIKVAKELMKQHEISLPLFGCSDGKADTCRELAIDIFFDDDLDKLQSVSNVVKNLYLFSWGYNLHDNEKPLATRVFSWADFYHKIQGLP